MSTITEVIIRGDFTQTEFADLIAFIRRLDDARPTAQIEITFHLPKEASIDDAERMIRTALPKEDGRFTDIVVIRET